MVSRNSEHVRQFDYIILGKCWCLTLSSQLLPTTKPSCFQSKLVDLEIAAKERDRASLIRNVNSGKPEFRTCVTIRLHISWKMLMPHLAFSAFAWHWSHAVSTVESERSSKSVTAPPHIYLPSKSYPKWSRSGKEGTVCTHFIVPL